ncbi:hypothetical protein L7F22_007949 [Adiantum nelumboides]|nr:hypothetical protein [Adiantum nelumboides]
MVGSFLSLVKNQDRMYEWATDLLRKSPSLTIRNVLFGLELYTTANPANVEYMLKTNFHNYTKGFRFQGLMEDMLGHGIFNVDGELWKAQRKAASYEFTSNSLKTLMLESVQREIADRLLPVLYGHICKASHGTVSDNLSNLKSLECTSCSAPVDLQDIFLQFAFDNICQISLGIDPECLNQSRKGDSFARAFDDATELIIQRFFTPAWIWQSKRLLNVGSERRLRKALDVVHSFAMNVVKQRKQECIKAKGDGRRQHSDLLFRLLRVATQPQGEQPSDSELSSKASEDKSVYENVGTGLKSDELVRDMVISFLLAGRDTSSIALSWFFWLLIQHPQVEAAIYEEITRVAKASRKGKYACARKLDFDDDVLPSGGGDKEQKGTGTVCLSDFAFSGGDAGKHVKVGNGSPASHDIDEDYVTVEMNNGDSDGNISGEKQHGDGEGNSHGTSSDDVHDAGCQPAYEAFTFEELKEMRYLQAALQEAMRLYPPVPHDTKLVVEEDVLPDGTRLCAGAQLAYHAYAMGRMESIWGEDWERFRPERWMEQQGPVSAFKWPVFQAGPRICLGKDMAMLQMKCVAAALIQRFAMTLEEGFGKPRYQLSFTLKMQQGLRVHLHPRHRHRHP